MESGPAIFAGGVFSLFGGALLVWTAVRVRRREPVAHGVSPAVSSACAALAALSALAVGAWCLSGL
ncbi:MULTISPECIES: hypothetical protein [unclassified Streptomyces]|uniref:hypothetical protein n=1 Tax=unclassified Streptomyces TaxID=2593676 RepID=UPI003D708F64